jgi:hypothetical protein
MNESILRKHQSDGMSCASLQFDVAVVNGVVARPTRLLVVSKTE